MNNTNSLAPRTNANLSASGARATVIDNHAKENFKSLIHLLQVALANIDVVYPQLLEAASLDRGLQAKIQASMKADQELLEYLKSKVEKGEALPPTLVAGLLNR